MSEKSKSDKKPPAKKKPDEVKAKKPPQKKAIGGLFNANTTAGRANVAKATYAGIFLTYLYFKVRKGKKDKPLVKVSNPITEDYQGYHETGDIDVGVQEEVIKPPSPTNNEYEQSSNIDEFEQQSNNDKHKQPSNASDKYEQPQSASDEYKQPSNNNKNNKQFGRASTMFKRRISPNPRES